MAEILQSDWIGLILVGLGTLFLLGEILVNLRGIFGLLGVFFIVLYFYTFLPDSGQFALMLIIYFVGIILILIDGKLINDGTLATLGFAGMILSIVITAPNLYAVLYAIIGVIVGAGASFIFLKIPKPRNICGKIAFKHRFTGAAGYSTVDQEHTGLVAKKGIRLTDVRRLGIIRIEDQHYTALSNAQSILIETIVEVESGAGA